jgi:hypothetical protein
MRSKKALVLLVVSVMLLINVARPSRAWAANTAILVIGSIAAFAAFVVVGTLLTRDKGPFSLQPTPQDLAQRDAPRAAVRFGTKCPFNDGRPSLACW